MLERLGQRPENPALSMDQAYEGAKTRHLGRGAEGGAVAGAPGLNLGEDDRELDKRHPTTEQVLRRLQGFRRSFPRVEKLDVLFLEFIVFALTINNTL